METTFKPRFWLMVGLILGAAALRLLPHPHNVTPVAAMALFAGATFERRRWAFAVPLGAMLLSDAVLELSFGTGFHSGIPAVYGSFLLIVCLGLLLRGRRTFWRVTAGALSSATLFYLTTNLAVWAWSCMYPRTPAGLAACYVAALPFYGLTLSGDLFYCALLFGSFAWAERRLPAFGIVQPA